MRATEAAHAMTVAVATGHASSNSRAATEPSKGWWGALRGLAVCGAVNEQCIDQAVIKALRSSRKSERK
jgi:hypothetical protein